MKLKLLLAALVLSGTLFAQPTPYARFPFDDNFLDTEENVTSSLMGVVEPTIVEDATRGMVAYFPGGSNTDANGVSLSLNSYSFDAVTYNVWVKFNQLSTWSRIFTFGTENVSGAEAETWATPANGRLGQRMSVTTDGGTDFDGVEVPYGDAPVATDTWYMFTAALNATNLKLWVDGVPAADSLHDSGVSPKDQVIAVAYLGKSVWPDPILDGYEDNFTIFDGFLTDEEVAAIYDAEYMEPGTAVKTVDNDINLVVYSSNNQILIINPENAVINSVQIYSITGSLVLQTNNFNGAINHNLPPNIYIVNVQSSLGNMVTKLVVK
jgi:hypothetical protein